MTVNIFAAAINFVVVGLFLSFRLSTGYKLNALQNEL
jgi:hypothetical protein